MRYLICLLASLVSYSAIADGPPLGLPAYIYCSYKNNFSGRNIATSSWDEHHLFVFEKNDRSRHGLLINGKYYQAQSHEATATSAAEFLSSTAYGQATLAESEDPRGGIYSIRATGYNSSADSNLPKYFLSVTVDFNSSDMPEITNVVNNDTNLQTYVYKVRCENLSKENAMKKMHLESEVVRSSVRI